MIIKKVRISGFDKLYEMYVNCIKEHRNGPGSGLFNFLNHCMISIEVLDITAIELFYLKKYSYKINIFEDEYKNFTDSKKDFDLNQKINGLLELVNEMHDDNDIMEVCSPNSTTGILPVGCHVYHVLSIFKSSSILSITGTMIAEIFKDTDNHIFEIYPGNEVMENKIAELFYRRFYTYMSDQVSDLDVVTDFMINKKFYQYIDSSCELAHINTPWGEIGFFGNDSKSLSKQLDTIKASQITSPYYLSDYCYVTFVFSTTFRIFLDLYSTTDYIIDHENLKLVFLKENISLNESLAKKYNARISNSLDYLVSYKLGLGEKTDINLSKFNYIFNGNMILYSVQVPLSKLNDFILNISKHSELDQEYTLVKNKLEISYNLVKPLLE